jgi:acetolactate synthase-1/2/3 large subunit
MNRGTTLSALDVMDSLNELAPRDAIYVCDLGEHLAFALHCLRITEGRDFISCLGFGAMGSSIPTGIGIALGSADRRVFVICGDGGFNLSGSELATAAQLNASVTVVLLNDSRLNMCHHGMLDTYGRTNDFHTQTIDFSKIGAAYGVDSEVVHTREELAKALKKPVSGPRLLDLRVDAEVRVGRSQRTATLQQFMDSTSPQPQHGK